MLTDSCSQVHVPLYVITNNLFYLLIVNSPWVFAVLQYFEKIIPLMGNL